MVNPYLEVVGTLREPRISLDEKSAFIVGGAAAATGGISILAKGLWDRLKSSGDLCEKVTTSARETIDNYANRGNP